jgi:hypothetical protein
MSHLDARDDLREMAEHYETIAALDLTPEQAGAHGAPGSRVPPGMQEILNAEEITSGLVVIDDWATFCVHVLVDEHIGLLVHGWTPARLRLIGEFTQHFLDHEDEMLALSFADDLHDNLRTLRKLARRGTRQVRTGMECQDPICVGHYVAVVGTNEDAICCDKCKHRVEYSVWSSWPRTGHYVTVEHAARMAGITIVAVKQRARRGQWRRTGEGRDVRYHVDDLRRDCPA